MIRPGADEDKSYLVSLKPQDYTIEEQRAMPSKAQEKAAFFGVPQQYLRYADTPLLGDFFEEHGTFRNVKLLLKGGEYDTLSSEFQYQKLGELLESWPAIKPLIIINAFPSFFFNEQVERDVSHDTRNGSGEAFLYHLVGFFANRAVNYKYVKGEPGDSGVHVSFLNFLSAEYYRGYARRRNQVVTWGLLTDKIPEWDINKTMQYLFYFRPYTRILLTSVENISALLGRLNISTSYVDYIFNLQSPDLLDKGKNPSAFLRPEKRVKKEITI